jgi:hypothetical protein
MPTVYALLPDSKPQFLDSAGDPLSGGQLFIYTAGSSTKATTYTESDGATPNANPVVLNSRGETASGVYAATGTYKLVLAPAADTDPPASAIWTRDNVTPINDIANATATEWTSTGLTPTYTGATTFTLVGDQTAAHHVGRRVKATISAGTVYGYISVSAYTSLTTVTVVLDSGTLDAGLSDVSLGFLRADNLSMPGALTARGDVVTRNATSPVRLALGAALQVIGSDGTDTTNLWQNIVQVKYAAVTEANFSTTTTASTGFGAGTGITNLSVNLTPKAATHRVLVFAMVRVGHSTTGSNYLQLRRDNATVITVGDAASNRIRTGAEWTGTATINENVILIGEDFPNGTSAYAYNVHLVTSTGTAYVNRSGTDTDSTSFSRGASIIVAIEYKP